MLATLIVEGLYIIPVGAVNTFFIDSPTGCVLIDTGFPGSEGAILQAIGELGKKPTDLQHIVLTHSHPDHIGSYAALKRATGAQGYIHPLDAPLATSGVPFRPLTPSPGLINGILFRRFIHPEPPAEAAPVEHLVQDGDILPILGGLKAVHIPGHCAGQLAFLWDQHGGLLFAADACSNMMGLGWSLGHEDFEEGKRSLRKLAKLDFKIATFGHGNALMSNASQQFHKKWG